MNAKTIIQDLSPQEAVHAILDQAIGLIASPQTCRVITGLVAAYPDAALECIATWERCAERNEVVSDRVDDWCFHDAQTYQENAFMVRAMMARGVANSAIADILAGMA